MWRFMQQYLNCLSKNTAESTERKINKCILNLLTIKVVIKLSKSVIFSSRRNFPQKEAINESSNNMSEW